MFFQRISAISASQKVITKTKAFHPDGSFRYRYRFRYLTISSNEK